MGDEQSGAKAGFFSSSIFYQIILHAGRDAAPAIKKKKKKKKEGEKKK